MRTRILLAAALIFVPALGACDSSLTGPELPSEDTFSPQMGLGTSPVTINEKGGVIQIQPKEKGGIVGVQPSGRGVIIQ